MISQFARNPADALQCFADIQATVKQWDASHYDPTFDYVYKDDPSLAASQADLIKKLYVDDDVPHEIYWWPTLVAETVSQAASVYPVSDASIEWNRQGIHVTHVFQRPLRVLTEDRAAAISAISYCRSAEKMLSCPWCWNGPQSRLQRMCLVDGAKSFQDTPAAYLAQIQWLYAATRFAESRIIGCSTAVVNRKVRERIIGHVPDVNVVHLRSYEPGTRDESSSDRHIDFDFRFWVRGHPRKLSGRDEPIWISTYLKGPADKPIKDRETVFAVTR